MSAIDLASVRAEYMRERLDERDAARDPLEQFQSWFDEALRAELPMANAMTLATAASNRRPSARMVLLKGYDERGFVFFTDYESRKGAELASNPQAALLFYWIELEREVRVEGRVEKTSADESDSYFLSRPLGSRLAATASRQSSVVASRDVLESAYTEASQRLGDAPVRPERWGGFRVIPDTIEFWQGRANRLHDRLLYTRAADGWVISRLSP